MGAGVVTEEEASELKFSFFYCMFSFWSSGILVLVCMFSEGVEVFGQVLHSVQFLGLAALFELGKVWAVKVLTCHAPSLRLPPTAPADTKPVRGPFLRRVWTRLSRLWTRLTPLAHLAKGLLLLLTSWLAIVYITVCLGAPVTGWWTETAGFCALLTLLTCYPVLLVLGPSTASISTVTSSPVDTSLAATLFVNSVCAAGGSWFGAFPIPLDWDRPWQAWPITCCLGAVTGHVLGNLAGSVRLWPKMASMKDHYGHPKRKFV